MKVLVTGYNGQLGFDVVKELKTRDIECLGVDIDDFDITDEEKTREYIKGYNPDVVVHCSAYTAVDKAEENIEACRAVNVCGPKNIAKVCNELDCKLVYISTDYVFPGVGERFYEVGDPTGPLGQYGITKLDGEKAVLDHIDKYFIVRISWVFGLNGNNFIKTMLRVGKDREEVSVVYDQIGSPTYTADLAKVLCDMLVTEKYGIYHATNEGVCSWAEFTEEIFRLAGYNTKVKRVTTEEYGAKAPRPKNSRLSKESLVQAGFEKLPDWKDALVRYMEELKMSEE